MACIHLIGTDEPGFYCRECGELNCYRCDCACFGQCECTCANCSGCTGTTSYRPFAVEFVDDLEALELAAVGAAVSTTINTMIGLGDE